MSLVPIGMANDSTAVFEENTAVVSGPILVGLSSDPLPVDGKLEYTLIDYAFGGGRPIVDLLIDITILFEIDCPAGEVDNSQLEITLAGNLDRPANYDRDIISGTYTGFTSGIPTFGTGISGLLKIQYNEKAQIRISRIGGNPAVAMTLTDVYRKFKKLD